MNISLLLEMVADGDPERIVVGHTGTAFTASELLERSRRAAGFLTESGASYVGYFGLNSDALPLALFGAAAAGLPFVPINYRSTDEQLRGLLKRIPNCLLIADADTVNRLATLGADRVLSVDEFVEAATTGALAEDLPFVDPDEVAVLLFTSGTTSEPKVAVLRHRHLVSYVITSIEFLGCDRSEAQLVCVPSYHIAGVSAVLSSLYSGRRIVYLPAFEPNEWVQTVLSESITHAMVVPTMLGRILNSIDEADVELSTLRHLSYGGGKMPLELVERTLRTIPNVDLVNAYGLTETSSTIAMLTPDDHRLAFASADPAERKRLGSVGQPLPGLEVEVRGPDDLQVPAEAQGEIWVHGEQVAGEYEGRSALDSEGWFRTRDLGWFDQAGYLYLAGRMDDVIVRGAENISPGEIEDVLMSHPSVIDVAVVGIPDPEWGEAVAAVVVIDEGAPVDGPELQEWVRGQLRSTKTPALVEFRQELPYNPTGKLLRRQLRDELSVDAG